MRHQYEYKRTYSTTAAIFTVNTFNQRALTTLTNRRDLFLRTMFRVASGENTAYLLGSLAEAQAIANELADTNAARDAAGVIAYHLNFTLDSTLRTFTMTNNAGVDPNMAGLKLSYNGAGSEAAWDAVWGFDAAPAAVILDEILYRLQQRTGDGQALAGFASAGIQIGADDTAGIDSHDPSILAAVVADESIEAASGSFGFELPFSIYVGALGADAGDEDDLKDLIRAAGNVRSIIFDEHRRLTDLVTDCVHVTTAHPAHVAGLEKSEPYLAVRIEGKALVDALVRDNPI